MIRGARRRVRGDFSQRKMSEQHQRRKWARPTYGHDPAGDRLAACPSGPPSRLRGSAAPSIVVFGQVKEMGAAFPKFLSKGNEKMKFEPTLAAMLAEPWSNNACRGYVIYAMENCGFSPEDIRRVVGELHYVFDFKTLDEAQHHYENGPY